MARCIDVMEEVLSAVARGEAVLPLRQMVTLPDDAGLLATMPSALPGNAAVKVITVFTANEGTEFDSHQGVVILFESGHGVPQAVIDATSITAIRTAAVSGAVTRALAREDATELAILGSGTQARTHLEAMRVVRPIRRVRVWSRTPDSARAFAREEAERQGVDIEAVPEAREAVEGADILCTTTSAREPVLRGSWLAPGAHVNAVGYAGPTGRELDAEAMRRARIYVDRRESTINESGDFRLARDEGAIDDSDIVGEVGELFIGKVPGRSSADEITLFESLGLAVEDLAAAREIYARALEQNAGVRVALGGHRRPTAEP
jgi:ornithine cyclodeaminase/alanine dehydrogenase-like protein (mu-crystallin family)